MLSLTQSLLRVARQCTHGEIGRVAAKRLVYGRVEGSGRDRDALRELRDTDAPGLDDL